jgi:hypothetical protein
MKKENIIKALLIFGGGYLAFSLYKSSKMPKVVDKTKNFDSTPKPNPENAKIVITAYMDALNAGETPSRLTELNKECLKEFGMKCYVNDKNEVIVCDAKGNTISA